MEEGGTWECERIEMCCVVCCEDKYRVCEERGEDKRVEEEDETKRESKSRGERTI